MAKSPQPTGQDLSQAIQAFNPQSVAIAASRGNLPTQDTFIGPQKLTNVTGPAPKVEIPNLQGPAGTLDARGPMDVGAAPTLESQPAYQVARSLQEFAPKLNQFLDYLGKDWIQKNIRYGQAQYNQDPAYWGKLITQEPDPAVRSRLQSLNPWAAETVEQSVAQAEAVQYPAWLRTRVASNPVIDDKGTRLLDVDPGSGAATEYIARQRSEFIKEKGLQGLNPRIFSETVTPSLAQGDQQATETYYARAAEVKKQRVEESQNRAMGGIMASLGESDVKKAQDGFDAAFFSPNAGPWAGRSLPEQKEILRRSIGAQIDNIVNRVRIGVEDGGISPQEAKEQLRNLEAAAKELAIGSPLAAEGRPRPFAEDPELSAGLGEAVTKAILSTDQAVIEAARTDYREKVQERLAALGDDPAPEDVAAALRETQGDVLSYLQRTGDQESALAMETQRQRLASTLGSAPRDEEAYNTFSLLVAGVDAEGKPLEGGPVSAIEALRRVGGGDYKRGMDLVAGTGEDSMQMRSSLFQAISQDESGRIKRIEKAQEQATQEYEKKYNTWARANKEAVQAAGQVYSTIQSQARMALELGGATPQQKNNILNGLNQQMPKITALIQQKYEPLLKALASDDPAAAERARATLDSADFILKTKEEIRSTVLNSVPGLGAVIGNLPQGGAGGATFGGVTERPPAADLQKKLWGSYTVQNFQQDLTSVMNGKEPSEAFKQRIRDRTGGKYTPSAVVDTLATYIPMLDGTIDAGKAPVEDNKQKLKRMLAQQHQQGIVNPLTQWASGSNPNKPQQSKEEKSWLEMLGQNLNNLFKQNKPQAPQAGNPFIQAAYADQASAIPMGMDRTAVMREARRTRISPQILAAAVAANGGYGSGPSGGGGNQQTAYQLLLKYGVPPRDAKILAAVGRSESSDNPRAHNPNRETGDNSYGYFQINMIDALGPERRAQFGIAKNEQLWDLETNAKAAAMVYRSQGLGAWTEYKNGNYQRYLNGSTGGSGPSAGGTSPRSVANALAAAHRQAKREGKGIYRALEIVGGKDYANQVVNHAKVLGWGDQATITQFTTSNRMPFKAGSQGPIWVDPSIRRGRMSVAPGYNHVQFGNSADRASNDVNYKLTQARAADALIQQLYIQGNYDIEIPGPAEANFRTKEQVQKFLRLPQKERLRKIVMWGDQHHGGPARDSNWYWAIDINFKTTPGKRWYLPSYGSVISDAPSAGVVSFDSGVEVVHGSGLHGSW